MIMKKLIALLPILLMTADIHAQVVKDTIVYKYIIAQPQGKLFSDKCKLRIDDGIKPEKAKGDKDKSITFNSFAAALMYLTSQGWKLVSNYSIMEGGTYNGYGGTETQTYWVLRKPSTKEEVQTIVDKSIKKEE